MHRKKAGAAQDSSGLRNALHSISLKIALLQVAAAVTSKQKPGAPKDDACCVLMPAQPSKLQTSQPDSLRESSGPRGLRALNTKPKAQP